MDAGVGALYFARPLESLFMSAQNLSPHLPFACWDGAFTESEMDRIEVHGDKLTNDKATLFGRDVSEEYDEIRITRTAWIKPSPETKWIYDRIQSVVRTLNDRIWQFDLSGFSEDFQYTIYQGSEGGHYNWHVDQGDLVKRRKLSLSLQLSDPSQYDGCELQLHGAHHIDTVPKTRGTLIAFPSYVLHRVTPITRGIRKSLVVWTTGPKFR
jgi:PKHD-type hydroxylase